MIDVPQRSRIDLLSLSFSQTIGGFRGRLRSVLAAFDPSLPEG